MDNNTLGGNRMASAISYEFYTLVKGNPNGIASLDGDGKLLVSQLPPSAVETYKGEYDTEAALVAAFETASLGDYAYVSGTGSYWYWNDATDPHAWVNQEISSTAYSALSAAEKAAVPYIVVS